MSKRLGRQEWIDAGLRAIAGQGVEAVRVERLAEALKVTKGSFYWHFKDRSALFEALLEAWKGRTNDIIAEVEAKGGDAGARLRTLCSIVLQSNGSRLDLAIRAWAAQDAAAERALKEVDRRRFSYLKSLFQGLGFSPAEAAARARLVYHALIGQFMMGAPSAQRERLAEYMEIILPMLVRK